MKRPLRELEKFDKKKQGPRVSEKIVKQGKGLKYLKKNRAYKAANRGLRI
jgi:hypothetical protein